MRIAWLVHQYLPESVGGTELYTHGLATRAQTEGHDVLVITYGEHPDGNPAAWGTRERLHERVRVLEIEHNLSLAASVARFEYDNPEVGGHVRAALSRFRPDVVHCTHAMKLSAAALKACADLDVPIVVTLCDYWFVCPRHTLLTWDGRACAGPDDWRACFACTRDLHGIADTQTEREAVRDRPERLRRALGLAVRIVALSRFQARLFAGQGVDPGRIETIPHGLELDGLVRTPNPAARVRIVSIGSLVPHKGHHVAMAALRERPGLDLELVVHGAVRHGDPYVERLLADAARDPRVTLAGEFPPAELGSVLAEADALVLAALWYENDPLVVKAALHVGLPVIASRIGSLEEQVNDGVDGWTFPPGDVDACAAAFERVVRDRRRLPPKPQPSMDDHYRRMAEIYAEVARS